MKLIIIWRDGDNEAAIELDRDFEDGEVIDLRVLPKEPGEYVGDVRTGEIHAIPTGRPN